MQLNAPQLDREVLDKLPPGPLGIAVSGGSDSTALVHLLNDWGGRPLAAVTVDHDLRPGSAAEAIAVATMCRSLRIPHTTLTWQGWNGRGNLQDAARTARRQLITTWAKRHHLGAVALGHTADDQAETFLMRLSRGSGLEGLSSMESETHADGLSWVRPLLPIRREALRDYLKERGINWVDDPSNDNPAFGRVRMRNALKTLQNEGIDVPRIVATTRRLQSAKEVLFTATRDLADVAATMHPAGDMTIDIPRLLGARRAVQLRLLSEALRHISAAYYAPRAHQSEAILDALDGETFEDQALIGCLVRRSGQTLTLRREPARVAGPAPTTSLWDDRWRITGPDMPNAQVAALGEPGLSHYPAWRETGLARETLLTTPAIFEGETLIAAPFVEESPSWHAEFAPVSAFFTMRQT